MQNYQFKIIAAREYPAPLYGVGDESAINSSRNRIPRSLLRGTFINLKFLIAILSFALLIVNFKFTEVYATTPDKVSDTKTKPEWKYIVIHHSATKRGNARMFECYHVRRGMQNGLAYHFVIDNGTCGKRDGQLEIGYRWKKQLPGGHCRQQWVNEHGIGICLVGNFNITRPTYQQIRTLVNVVQQLREKYNIQIKYVVGHGKIKGEKSECPGKYFPWADFYSGLKEAK